MSVGVNDNLGIVSKKIISSITDSALNNAERVLIMATITAQIMEMLDVKEVETDYGKINLSITTENNLMRMQ